MSKIDLSKVIDPKAKTSPRLVHKFKNTLIALAIMVVVFGTIIMFISAKIVDLPFKTGNRNLSVAVIDSINVSENKIDQVKKSFLQILPRSFWDHKNFTDIDYSKQTIGLAVNNALGYNPKEQLWTYQRQAEQQVDIISVLGELVLDNVRYEAMISFSLTGDNAFFYDLKLKEKLRKAEFQIASSKQKILLIQKMYRS